MSLPYYTHSSGLPANQTRALASQVRDELDEIAASFGLLPIPSAIIGGISNYAVDTGAANAYVISVSPSTLIAYADGLTLRFKSTNANTTASTINVNGLGLKTIVRPDNTSLVADDIYAGQICQISYNATTGVFQLALTPLAAVYQALAYANAAATSASTASSAAASAAASFDSFDDRYLGAKSSNPTLDNDGNTLLTGAMYFNTVSNEMRVWSGSAWVATYLPSTEYVTNSDLTTALATKQNTLVSGTNIKTVNGSTLLGSGNLSIAGVPDFLLQNAGII